jgi:hypothetical protein
MLCCVVDTSRRSCSRLATTPPARSECRAIARVAPHTLSPNIRQTSTILENVNSLCCCCYFFERQ